MSETPKISFYDLTYPQLRQWMADQGEKPFRAQQLFKWIYRLGVDDLDQMTDVSKKLRARLPDLMSFERPKMVKDAISEDGTRKFLFQVPGGHTVESVLIPSDGRLTLCVSTEVGCNMACQFCFTGKQKLKRRLTTGEVVSQFVSASRALPEGMRISNIVYMGMGEPLDNCQAVFDSIEIFHEPIGCNLSKKKITVSTSGIVPEIQRVTESGVRLAVSLNAVNDEVRTKIMPINKKWPLETLLQACRDHTSAARDKVTLEYVLLKNVTDSLDDARKLYRLTRDIPCKINIIPFNEHPNSGFLRPSEERIVRFQDELMRLGAHVLRRRTMGRDIYAACGQLTSAYDEHPTRMN